MSFALLTLLREIYCYKLGAVDECSFGLASNQVEKPLDDERPPLLQDGRCHKAYAQEFRVEKPYAPVPNTCYAVVKQVKRGRLKA